MVRTALVVAGVVVLVLALITGRMWGFQRKLIYLPDAGPVGSADAVLPGARDVVRKTSDGLELAGWFVPGRSPDAATVLVANGNGGHRGMRAPLAQALSDEGLGVLLFDYRGYGGNPGTPTEDGLACDVRAARAPLVEEEIRVRPEEIGIVGAEPPGLLEMDLGALPIAHPFRGLSEQRLQAHPLGRRRPM